MILCLTLALAYARPPLIVNGMPFNRENDLLDVRVKELRGVVDAILVVESRYTQFGTPKPLRYNPHPSSLVHYLVMEWRPPGNETGCTLGWKLEGHQRDHVLLVGMHHVARSLGTVLQDNDILILTDADEIPSHRLVQRVRERPPHDGTIHPIIMRRFLYNFAWQERHYSQQAAVANVATWNTWKRDGHPPRWGMRLFNGGWHCSKCFHPLEFNERFKDYLCGDGVRWGDFNWSHNAVAALIGYGIWPGAFPTSRRPRRVDAMRDGPKSAWRYPYLVMPPHPPPKLAWRMAYCGSNHPDLRALERAWC